MTESTAPQAPVGTPAIFIANHPGLDFLNSIASPTGGPLEWLGDGNALVAWLQQSQLVPNPILKGMVETTSTAELDAVAKKARALRQWFRGFVDKHRGRALSQNALKEVEPINRILRSDSRYGEIAYNPPGSFMLVDRRRWNSAESLLIPIAEALARLVAEEDFAHVKGCEGHACTLLFVDKTRRHARRWCSMAACGNRAKVAAYRKRENA